MKKTLLAVAALSAATALFSCARAGAKQDSQEMIINNSTEPQSLDPVKIQGVPEHRIFLALFEGLVGYDPKTCEPVPGVAESWSRSGENGEILTFKLRDAVWSDETPITAQTFVDSWLYYLSPDAAAEYAYMPAAVIKGAEAFNAGKAGKESVAIRAVDEKTFEVTLVGRVPYAEAMMGHYAFAPLPMHAIEKYGDEWIKPGNFVGNGPFVLESWKPQEAVTVVPNDKYWNKENVFLSRLTFLPIENETTSYNKFKAGEIDWDVVVPLDMMNEARVRDDYHDAPFLSTYYYEFNVNDPVLKNVDVRKAIAMAIDSKELVEKVRGGNGIPTSGFVPPMEGYEPAKGNPFNPEAARALLAKAGYPDGKGFPKIEIIYNTQEAHKKIAEYVQAQLKTNLGIDVELANMEWATFLDKRQSNDFQIARAGWSGDYADPSNFLELCLANGGNNDGRYNNPHYDALMAKAASMSAGPERMAVLREAEDLMLTEEQAYIPFYWYMSTNLIDLEKWDGWHSNVLDIHPYVGIKRK